MTHQPRPRPERADTPELAAFRQIKISQPELGGAIDMQVELVDHVDEVLKIALLPPETPPVRVEAGVTGDVIGTVPDGMTH